MKVLPYSCRIDVNALVKVPWLETTGAERILKSSNGLYKPVMLHWAVPCLANFCAKLLASGGESVSEWSLRWSVSTRRDVTAAPCSDSEHELAEEAQKSAPSRTSGSKAKSDVREPLLFSQYTAIECNERLKGSGSQVYSRRHHRPGHSPKW